MFLTVRAVRRRADDIAFCTSPFGTSMLNPGEAAQKVFRHKGPFARRRAEPNHDPLEKMCPLPFVGHPSSQTGSETACALLRRRSKMLARRRLNPSAVFLSRPPPGIPVYRGEVRRFGRRFWRGRSRPNRCATARPENGCCSELDMHPPRRKQCIPLSSYARSALLLHAPRRSLRISRCGKYLVHAEAFEVRKREVLTFRSRPTSL
jgi:hypothetical protein